MKRDIQAFRNALQSNQADAEQLNKETSMSLFEIACQTPNCSEFITACIEAGCDVNKVISGLQNCIVDDTFIRCVRHHYIYKAMKLLNNKYFTFFS